MHRNRNKNIELSKGYLDIRICLDGLVFPYHRRTAVSKKYVLSKKYVFPTSSYVSFPDLLSRRIESIDLYTNLGKIRSIINLRRSIIRVL